MKGWLCAVWIGLAGAAPAVAAPAEENTIDVGERIPLAFVLSSPTGASARTRTSDLIRLVDAEARHRTGLVVQTVDDMVTKGCRGRLLCVVLRIRTDYERESLRDGRERFRPYREHVATMKERGTPYAKLLLFVTNITREGEPDRLSAQLIDTDQALERYHTAAREGEDWEANVEAAINEDALATPRTEITDEAGAERFVRALFADHLRPALERAGVWEPYGRIALTSRVAGLAITMDGASVGLTQPGGVTQLAGVTPGSRSIAVEGPDVDRFEARVDVVRGETVTLEAEVTVRARGGRAALRVATIAAGAAAVIAGGVITGIALGTAPSGASAVCFRGGAGTCESGRELVRFGYDADRFGDQNGDGLLMAPLGLGLVGAGATWGLGTWLWSDEAEVPWIPIVAGAAVGVLTYVIAAAANPTLYEPPP